MSEKRRQLRCCDSCGSDVLTYTEEPVPVYCRRCITPGETQLYPETRGRRPDRHWTNVPKARDDE